MKLIVNIINTLYIMGKKLDLVERNYKHGKAVRGEQSYLYITWCNIKERCFNSNREDYKRYGGRGITVCEEWVNSYESFEEYILSNLGERPKGHTLDRIDNDGNYEPGNVRWATKSTQILNQRTRQDNTSGVKGVSWNKKQKRWVAKIGINHKVIHLGSFNTKEEATVARLAGEEKYHKPLVS